METKRWRWTHQDFISSKWIKEGKLNCPDCNYPVHTVVETKDRKIYYHSKTARCVVMK